MSGRSFSLDTVDRSRYDRFEVVRTGTDEWGPYWLASVEVDGVGFLTGNYYCIEAAQREMVQLVV